jgi:hypothetical protein
MMRTATIEVDHRTLIVDLPYSGMRGETTEAVLTVRALEGRDELEIEEAWERGHSAARIATSIIGSCASGSGGPIGVDGARALSAGDREVVLRSIYAATFSDEIEAQVECGAGCGEPVCFELELASLTRIPSAPEHYDRGVPDGRDLEDAAERGALVLACLDGTDCDPDEVARLDPNAECEIALTCPACDRTFSAWLDGFELIRQQTSGAGGILAQVDLIASAYGWTEDEILALPRERRLRYCAFAQVRAA